MPFKYKYEGKDNNGKKKFSKIYKPQRWVGDYENNCVRDYDNYIKDALKRGIITEDDIQYIDYFQGTFENACKFFNISGSSCLVRDKEIKENVVKTDEESEEIKIERFKKLIIKHQSNKKFTPKSSYELYNIILSNMNSQYYYIDSDRREDIACEIIDNLYHDYIIIIDAYFILYLYNYENSEEKDIRNYDRLILKRATKLRKFLLSNQWAKNLFETNGGELKDV